MRIYRREYLNSDGFLLEVAGQTYTFAGLVKRYLQICNDTESGKRQKRGWDGRYEDEGGSKAETKEDKRETGSRESEGGFSKKRPSPKTFKRQLIHELSAQEITVSDKKINKDNFFEETIASFTLTEKPKREPDYKSDSGSKYWYEGDYLIRESDHWGQGIASCDWFLNGEYSFARFGRYLGRPVAKTKWEDFVSKDGITFGEVNRIYISFAKKTTERDEERKGNIKKAVNNPSFKISNAETTEGKARGEINKILAKPIKNKKLGIIACINTKQRDKILSQKAINKSLQNGFTKEQHYAVASKIAQIFEKAELIEEREDREGDANIKSVKELLSPVKLGSKTVYADILAKESIEHGHRVYTLELQSIEKLQSIMDTPD
jgi:hypothetical protein